MAKTDLQMLLNSKDEADRDRGFAELQRLMSLESEREAAVELLLTHFQDFIVRQSIQAMLRVTRASFSAQDIAQMVAWKLTRRLKDGRVELRSLPQFKVYLRTMVQRMAMDQVRVRPSPGNAELAFDPQADLTSPSATIRFAELLALLEQRLTTEDRDIFRMRMLESRDWREIAEQIAPEDDSEARSRRADALRIRLSRALKSIQEEWKDCQLHD